jgi:putative ABC transport system substrate-binding protein
MKGREFLGVLGAAMVVPRVAQAQAQGRTYDLGTLNPVFPMTEATPFGKTLIKALSEHGYVVGQT